MKALALCNLNKLKLQKEKINKNILISNNNFGPHPPWKNPIFNIIPNIYNLKNPSFNIIPNISTLTINTTKIMNNLNMYKKPKKKIARERGY
jgi:hypothetical protein